MKQTYELNKRRIYALGLTADLKDDNGKVHHFIDGYEYVEIGGIKWATMNIGAEKETDRGLYFQWGETIGYKNARSKCFSWECYKYGDCFYLSKYNILDGLTKLEACDDTATVNMSKSWRMPTEYDFCTLLNATTNRWVTNYQGSGINGRLFISNEDSSKVLFFPACGYCESGRVYNVSSCGFYWSSSLCISSIQCANLLCFNESYVNCGGCLECRFYGFSVRGVINC